MRPAAEGKIPLLPGDYLVNLDEDSAVLRNYENNTYHYPQPGSAHGRELPIVGAHLPGAQRRMGATEERPPEQAHLEGNSPYQDIVQLIGSAITSEAPIENQQIQPASLDLQAGEEAYRLISSFCPNCPPLAAQCLGTYQSDLVMYEMDLSRGAILERPRLPGPPSWNNWNCCHASCGPIPRATGRLDVFTRGLDLNAGFDEIRAGYRGRSTWKSSPAHSPSKSTGRLIESNPLRRGVPRSRFSPYKNCIATDPLLYRNASSGLPRRNFARARPVLAD